MFKRLYDWTTSLANRPGATWALALVSFAESSFFPIPPDVMLAPMALAQPRRAWFYAFVCTLASVAGALLGYAIGYLLFDSLGMWLIRVYGMESGVEAFRQSYAEYGHWIILLKGLTPIPFKLITIMSGFAGYNLLWFVLLCLVTRGVRFALVAGAMQLFAEPIRRLMDRHAGVVGVAVLGFIVAGFAAAKFLF
ncbi:YqaA family protein [Camelimonas abortus]|uniref:YqaA family protein n=1 Tax=Camelimonas abortus TaxID=1017184 RepID=A0ABV7LHZ4_9HYPH